MGRIEKPSVTYIPVQRFVEKVEHKHQKCVHCQENGIDCVRPAEDESCDRCLQRGLECYTRFDGLIESDSDDEEPDIMNPLEDVTPQILVELKHLDLAGRLTFNNNVVSIGAYGDICKSFCTLHDGKKTMICAKRLRLHLKIDVKHLFEKEIYVWNKLAHINLLPLLGYAFDQRRYPVLISEWMDKGSSWAYVRANPNCNPTRLVRGMARGLAYMHEKNVVHSDLKSDNVLVTSSGDARICDFGCSRTTEATRSLAEMTSGIRGTSRYIAYELFTTSEMGNSSCQTKATDVWAFGMTIYELLVQKRPYDHLREREVPLAIYKRELPTLPPSLESGISDRLLVKDILWDICQRCWMHEPEHRPDIQSILSGLNDRIAEQDIRILRNFF